MSDAPNNETRIRILDVADELFSKRGYSSVTLRDIATAVGMRHASLYYYVPGGKKQLFIEVMERNFHRHREGLIQAIAGAGDSLRDQMYAVALWLISQPPLDFSRMRESDMSEISEEQAQRLMELAFDALRTPIVTALARSLDAGEIDVPNLDVAAMALVSLIGSVHNIPARYRMAWRERVARQLVDMLLDGWRTR